MKRRLLSIKTILISAFILRITISLLGEHGDVINYHYWAMDIYDKGLLGFYDRNIANAMRPTYPPLTSHLFYLTAFFHNLIWHLIWFLNNAFVIFPSNLIFWWESERGWYFINKWPSIIADLGIIYILYLFPKVLGYKKNLLLPSLFFAFLPPFWYVSALWGQTDSIYAFFVIAGFYFLAKEQYVSSFISVALSMLTKPTAFFALPAYLVWYLKKAKPGILLKSIVISLIIGVVLYFPFHPDNFFVWVIRFYNHSLAGELQLIVANSFNVWGGVFGFKNTPETTSFFGIPANLIGNSLFVLFTLGILFFSFLKQKDLSFERLLILSSIISFAAFLFLPGMHERYFFPTLLVLLPLVGISKKIRNVFLAMSAVHLLNLYNFWFLPRVEILVTLLSSTFFIKLLVIINILIFFYLIKIFKSGRIT